MLMHAFYLYAVCAWHLHGIFVHSGLHMKVVYDASMWSYAPPMAARGTGKMTAVSEIQEWLSYS